MTYADRLRAENTKVVLRKLAKADKKTPSNIDTLEIRVSGSGEKYAAQALGMEVASISPAGVWQSWVPQFSGTLSRADLAAQLPAMV